MKQFGKHWSHDSQLVWWGGLSQGDTLILEIQRGDADGEELQLHLSRAHDYGIFSFQLDDGPMSDAYDLYDPKVLAPMVVTLRLPTLSKGKHQLKIVCQGKHNASTNTLLGIDCVVWSSKKPEERAWATHVYSGRGSASVSCYFVVVHRGSTVHPYTGFSVRYGSIKHEQTSV